MIDQNSKCVPKVWKISNIHGLNYLTGFFANLVSFTKQICPDGLLNLVPTFLLKKYTEAPIASAFPGHLHLSVQTTSITRDESVPCPLFLLMSASTSHVPFIENRSLLGHRMRRKWSLTLKTFILQGAMKIPSNLILLTEVGIEFLRWLNFITLYIQKCRSLEFCPSCLICSDRHCFSLSYSPRNKSFVSVWKQLAFQALFSVR